MRDLEVLVAVVAVADESEAVGADRYRGVSAHVHARPRSIDRGERGGGAVRIRAVGDLEAAVVRVPVADQPEAVGSDRDRVVEPDLANAIERGDRGGGAVDARAMRDLEVAVVVVEVADQPEPVGADRDRGVSAEVELRARGIARRDRGGGTAR